MTGNPHWPAGRRTRLGWIGRAALAVTAAGTIAVGSMGMASAGTQAGPARPAHTKAAVMVHRANRGMFGKILVAAKSPHAGRALYILPAGPCTGECLVVWPRLTLPKGKTLPKGSACLGTAKFGKNGRLQVTYHGKRLYLFDSDSGRSVNGNGVGGFKVAKVTAHC
ncbi:MAG: hypothetical protein ABJB47_14495 [Actinomycetota bacterium]